MLDVRKSLKSLKCQGCQISQGIFEFPDILSGCLKNKDLSVSDTINSHENIIVYSVFHFYTKKIYNREQRESNPRPLA